MVLLVILTDGGVRGSAHKCDMYYSVLSKYHGLFKKQKQKQQKKNTAMSYLSLMYLV